MRLFLFLVMFFIIGSAVAQNKEAEVLKRVKRFHEIMISDRFYIDQYVDDSLSYGHSNGWVENKNEFYSNLGSKMVYHTIKEDSINIVVNKNVAHVRFIGNFDVSMNGTRNQFALRVLEVWVKSHRNWKLFARQAIKR